MKPSEIKQAIKLHLEHPQDAMFIRGTRGIGKTTMPREVARELGIPFYYDNVPITDALERGGLPMINENKQMTYALPSDVPWTGPGIWLLDEFSKGQKIVMNTFSEILQERTLRGRPISSEVLIIMTGNLASERAGDVEVPSHIRDRVTEYTYEMDVDDWMRDFAIPNGIHELVRGLIHFRGLTLLSNPDNDNFSSPSPRGWEKVSRGLPLRLDNSNQLFNFVSGTVGQGAATEFVGFQRFAHKCPPFELIFNNPDTAPVPQELGVMFALIVGLSDRVTEQNNNALFRYLNRLHDNEGQAEMAVLAAKDIQARGLKFVQCEQGNKLYQKISRLLVTTSR